MTGTTFTHVNITATDWRALSRFYQQVFGCFPRAATLAVDLYPGHGSHSASYRSSCRVRGPSS